MKSIPVNVPKFDGNEAKYLVQAIESGWISSEGPFVNQFEQQFAKRHGRKHAIAVSSGTAALQCSVDALDLSPGDEIIIPSFTIISCVIPVIESGATPVLVDCDPETFNSAPEQIISAITPKTKAIMLVHIYGLPVDADPILEIARERGIKIIEDTAEAIGLEYKNRVCGSLGDVSTFSFYPNKHITTGEGGMVLVNDDHLGEKCKSLRNLCFGKKDRFYHEDIGWNFRMSNLQAAVGVAQLERISLTIQKKKEIGEVYQAALSNHGNFYLPLKSTSYCDNIYWVFGIVSKDNDKDAKWWMRELAQKGIGTRPFFYPMHKQPCLESRNFQRPTLPNAEKLATSGFYLPSGITITEGQIEKIVSLIDS